MDSKLLQGTIEDYQPAVRIDLNMDGLFWGGIGALLAKADWVAPPFPLNAPPKSADASAKRLMRMGWNLIWRRKLITRKRA